MLGNTPERLVLQASILHVLVWLWEVLLGRPADLTTPRGRMVTQLNILKLRVLSYKIP